VSRYFELRQNDSTGTISYVVDSGLGSTIATATAVFVVRNEDNETVFDDGVAAISSVTTADDGTKGATFSYTVTSEATENAGVYWGQFAITYTGGAVESVPKNNALQFLVSPDFAVLADVPAAAATRGVLQSQSAHGLASEDLIYWNGSAWAKAQADSASTLAEAIVLSVESTSLFRLAYLTGREVTLPAHGIGSGGADMYLSQGTAGLIATTAPTSGILQRVGQVKDANTLILSADQPEYL